MSSKSEANKGSKKRPHRDMVATRMWNPDVDPPVDYLIAAEDADQLKRAFKALGFDEPEDKSIMPCTFIGRNPRKGRKGG